MGDRWQQVEDTVLGILKEADMTRITEYKVREDASQQLGIDLSDKESKAFVRNVVESFLKNLNSKAEKPGEEAELEEDEKQAKKSSTKEYDDDGNQIICHLSGKRRVTIQDFKGRTLVSIREYYTREGKYLPSSKGISLTVEQWAALRNKLSAIEDAVEQMEG